ncbi:MAG: glutamate-5-semialdehyde dehydrogenase [Gammaproteobacteria bacterium]|mgnify:CR=1 FL=1|nr:glutamate-5-semialdehyde dehydrogenase [Gammaproteobacteria bacterium]|tara:strand:+ start:2245 stop:3510 length:1266 start_codon:yes stop_codon:yes gene_type:complete
MERSSIKKYIQQICVRASNASSTSAMRSTHEKNSLLRSISVNINKNIKNIEKSNSLDIKQAINNKLSDAMIDRLTLTKKRIKSMCDGLQEIIKIPDTLYKIINSRKQKSGIIVSQMRVPLGVIAMIYESRPNVTIDAAGLCLKSGNSVILRGGSEAIHTNKTLMKIIKFSLQNSNFDNNMVQLIETTDRTAVNHLITMDDYIDVIIPRGGKSLIKKISKNSKIAVIKHLDGNCHSFIDKSAKPKLAEKIVINSKTQRYGVCNAIETLLIHKDYSKSSTSSLINQLMDMGVKIKGCKQIKRVNKKVILAKESDWYMEYLAPILAVKIVSSIDDAINHIEEYGSRHTETIISNNEKQINKFLKMVNSSSVMVNTSTRFADGFEYGLGAEIGISTDKLHARGPVGLEGLTNLKYIVNSKGKIRN